MSGEYAGVPNDFVAETLFQLKFLPFGSLSDGIRALCQTLSVRWRLDRALPGLYISGKSGGPRAACFMAGLKAFHDDDETRAAALFHVFLTTWRDCLPLSCANVCSSVCPFEDQAAATENAVARALGRIEAQGGSSLAEIALFAVRYFAGDRRLSRHRRSMVCLAGVLDLAVCRWLGGGVLVAVTNTA